MNRKSWFYLGFFSLLALAFYFVLTLLIPGFGKVKLPVLNHVQPFSFSNQDGNRITEQDVRGKVYVAEYFFTTCPGICPRMNSNLKLIHQHFNNVEDFLILSHSVNPETDSVARMKRYADSLQVNTAKWYFLTGPKDSLYLSARISYLLDDPKNNAGAITEQFIHTQFFSLVDRKGKVRGIYDGLEPKELKKLEKDITSLLKEEN